MTGYAYETIANKPIIAGKTSGPAANSPDLAQTLVPSTQLPMLGMLARGAEGLSLWRRDEENVM
jgi:hypothetical protein